MALNPAEADDEGDEIAEISLDDLGAAYARAAAAHDGESFTVADTPVGSAVEPDVVAEPAPAPNDLVTPEAIIEAALFVGHPQNKPFSAQRLASLMRDVSPSEVEQLIDRLNASYQQHAQALRIVREDRGYRLTIAPQVEGVRRSFLGKVREARLTQAAIEVLSLVAYQPGITAQKIQDQRGQESGPVLNQLVRRQLLRIDRIKSEDSGRDIPHYFTTERFLVLFGLTSLDDLPHVEEDLRDNAQ